MTNLAQTREEGFDVVCRACFLLIFNAHIAYNNTLCNIKKRAYPYGKVYIYNYI